METVEFFGTNNTNSFKGKNVVITGATGGIGSVTTESLVKLGANVIAVARSEKKISEKLSTCIKKENFDKVIIDFENPNSINRGFLDIMSSFGGRVDIIIITHAIFKVGKLVETNIDIFDQALNVNVRSIFHFVSMASPFLKLSKGNVVIVSSLESFIPISLSFLNSVSKVSKFF